MSFEEEIKKKIDAKEDIADRIKISVLKYLWQVSPLLVRSEKVIPKFLRGVRVLKNFSDNELRILSNYLHHRRFSLHETIFKEGDRGVGFYFIFSGQVGIFAKKRSLESIDESLDSLKQRDTKIYEDKKQVVTLEKGYLFGELALLQENAFRTATAVAKENCELLGFFKPDLEELISNHPAVGARLLQSISIVIAGRLSSIALDMRSLKESAYMKKS
ncbi:MAG: cyclic nucleotide-binding domain-containing protein [Bacteriovoracales bacterium]|nr:cyclic nucleotide-binding domain-containing protein [Bacteriovoracales bacterium]